jgi:hypothetical protein
MKCSNSSMVQVCLVAAVLTLAVSATQAKNCSNATLNGTYGALIRGTASALPFAALDIVTADGKGMFSGTGTIAYNGVISQNVPISANYSIQSDCSGQASFSNGTTQTLVISEDGEEVQFIRTDNLNDQVTGDARRTDEKKCSNRSLRGNLGASLGGDAAGLPFVALDLVDADGAGNLTGQGTVSYNGSISQVSFTATYSVNSDCSGSITFDTGTTQNFVVVGKGSEVRFIRTDLATAVVTGIAKSLHHGD